MSDRYWITGVQLGMLLAYTKDGSMHNEAMELGDGIIDKQLFISNLDSPMQHPKIDESDGVGVKASKQEDTKEEQIKDILQGCVNPQKQEKVENAK